MNDGDSQNDDDDDDDDDDDFEGDDDDIVEALDLALAPEQDASNLNYHLLLRSFTACIAQCMSVKSKTKRYYRRKI